MSTWGLAGYPPTEGINVALRASTCEIRALWRQDVETAAKWGEVLELPGGAGGQVRGGPTNRRERLKKILYRVPINFLIFWVYFCG